jgi:hypothetical protein
MNKTPGQRLGYEKRKKQGDLVNLLCKPGKEEWGEFTVPFSMREVEAGVNLVLENNPSAEDDDWNFQKVTTASSPLNSQTAAETPSVPAEVKGDGK